MKTADPREPAAQPRPTPDSVSGILWPKSQSDAPLVSKASDGPTEHSLASGLARADLLRAERRLDDLAAYLGDLVERFGAEPALCVRYDTALQQIGHFDVAEALFSRLLTETPKAVKHLSKMAGIADKERNFDIAASRWLALCELHPKQESFHKGYVRSLLQQYETESASAYLEAIADKFDSPDFLFLRAELLEFQERFGEALTALDEIVRDKGDSPEFEIKRGAYLRGAGRLAEAEDHFQTLQRRRPEDVSVAVELASTASAAREYELACERWRALCETHPDGVGMHIGYIGSLLSLPDIERAQAHCDAVCDHLDNEQFRFNQLIRIHHAAHDLDGAIELLESRLDRFEIGREPLRQRVSLLLRKSQFLWRSYLIAGGRSKLAEMRSILEDVIALQPSNVTARFQRCKILVALGMEDEAKRVVDEMPRTLHPKMVTLRMWRAAQSGDHDAAKAMWDRRKTVHFIPHIEPPSPGSLRRKDENRIASDTDEIRVFTAIRNEKWRLPWFLDYYRKLGVNRFFFVDNNSSDGSGELLLEQPDVHVFWTDASYAASYSAMRWVNELAREYGGSGWVSYVDVDEALVFPGVEHTDLRRLTDYMESRDHEALQAFMLDMFSDESQSHSAEGDIDFVKSYPLFDSRFDKHPSINCPYVGVRGGARQIFGLGEFQTKTPLIRGGRDIAFLQSSHFISPARVSDVTGALLHFKLAGDFRETFLADLSDNSRIPACRRRYLRYEKYLQAHDGKLVLTNAFTQTYSGSEQLLALGLIDAPDTFRPTVGNGRTVET